MAKSKTFYSDIAYDDAFRTLESKYDDILIPFINYFFDENYDNNVQIIRERNDLLTETTVKTAKRRITDSRFSISQNGRTKTYHIECESKPYDKSILLRLFEYDSEIALYDNESEMDTIRVRFPHTGLLLLRNTKKIAQSATIIINTPGGEIMYTIPVVKESDFTLNDIFDKHLYLLIPFFIFNFEKDFKEINADKAKTNELGEVIKEIIIRLRQALDNGELSANSYHAIINLTHTVMCKLTEKHEALQEKVGDIMGGNVIEDLDVYFYNKGLEHGLEEGLEKGEAERVALLSENEALKEELEQLKKTLVM